METNSFWLISIEESNVLVSLVSKEKNNFSISSIGPKINWSSSEESFVQSINESLSLVSNNLNLSEEDEPESTAFIVPPFWVGYDGKIIESKLKLIETACKNLALRPMGFIANDEAIAENANSNDGFPASFILIDLEENYFNLSLVYLGKIKERIHKNFSDRFTPSLIESALLEINSDSALPPRIIVFGAKDDSVISEIKNFPWIGKKNIEVFLHFPDVEFYDNKETVNIFAKVIFSQIGEFVSSSPVSKEKITEEIINENEDIETVEDLEEVNASEFGFIEVEDENKEENIIAEPEIIPIEEVPKKEIPKKNFNFKIKIPKFPRLKLKKPLWVLAFTPLFLLIPFFFSKADITVFVTPYNFSKKLTITLDSTTNSFTENRFSVSKKTFDVSATASVKTTGEKTVGEKAKGEIIIFNKLEKNQNIPKGSILSDSSGKNFELANSTSVASGSSDLNVGVINLGQTKSFVSAKDIGPEFNLTKDTKLVFKDFSENTIIAKAKENFSGGSKQQVSVVSTQDKANLEKKINETIKESSNKKIDQDLFSVNGVIRETIQNKKDRIEFNREVGEEADELNASAQAKVSVFYLTSEQKIGLINNFLSKENGFDNAVVDPDSFNLVFNINSIDENKAEGVLSIEGKALPKINLSQVKKDISGKSKKTAMEIMKKNINRVYNFKINNNLNFLGFINPLPFIKDNIKINLKTETL